MDNTEAKIVSFVQYLRLRRYSERTLAIYEETLRDFFAEFGDVSRDNIRSYEVLMMDERELNRRTVNLHLSVISSFCSWLVKTGELSSNPVRTIRRPKNPSRLPEFYDSQSMDAYFSATDCFADSESLSSFKDFFSASGASAVSLAHAKDLYARRLARVVVRTLYSLGLRRAELISLNLSSLDFSRRVMSVHGKGDKMREIPVPLEDFQEISLYLQAVELLNGGKRTADKALFVNFKGNRLYPVAIDRMVKSELGGVGSIHGRKSPHVLRHTVATELLNGGSDINSIKEFLGHSSLATTQIYTHNSVAKLKKIYESAHPRAKNGGKYGD